MHRTGHLFPRRKLYKRLLLARVLAIAVETNPIIIIYWKSNILIIEWYHGNTVRRIPYNIMTSCGHPLSVWRKNRRSGMYDIGFPNHRAYIGNNI